MWLPFELVPGAPNFLSPLVRLRQLPAAACCKLLIARSALGAAEIDRGNDNSCWDERSC